jgi:hypothetical protein
MGARLVASNVQRADLTGCRIYGAFTWNAKLQGARQLDIVVTPPGETTVTVDGLEVAQFVNLLLQHKQLRDMLDPAASQFGLIVGNFTAERRNILDGIRNILRSAGCIPVSLDFGTSAGRDISDSLSALVQISRLVVADFTNAGSVAQKLDQIVSGLRPVPVRALLQSSETGQETPEHIGSFPRFGSICRFTGPEDLCRFLAQDILVSTSVSTGADLMH